VGHCPQGFLAFSPTFLHRFFSPTTGGEKLAKESEKTGSPWGWSLAAPLPGGSGDAGF